MNKKERALALRAEMDSLEKRKNEITNELYSLQREMIVTARYGNTKVTVLDSDQVYRMRLPVGTEYIRINQTLLNANEKDEHLRIFGSVYGEWRESIQSVVYFRLNGILLHEGGGYLVIPDKVLCSDEEWEQLKAGNIPERLLNSKIK